ncbi:MAG: molybdate ABC transporter permease subunit [Deltaproteobacteria bacterium]|jgi:molybdate transport system permease protein|nr:molybdate ABC transporter permease subunit [Deltaproteobacteria bacterium]
MENFSDPALLACILLTLRVAGIATLVSACLGLGLAWGMTRGLAPARRPRGRSVVDALCALPLVLPPTVIGYCLILLVGRKGLIGPLLQELGISLIFSWKGAVVAATVVIFPLTYRASRAALESVDHNLENAARTLGASEWEVFYKVSMPLAWRSIAAGVSLAFARGMGEFGATLMIAGNIPGRTQTLSLAIYATFQAGDDSRALALVLLTSVLCASLLVLAESLTSRRFSQGARL